MNERPTAAAKLAKVQAEIDNPPGLDKLKAERDALQLLPPDSPVSHVCIVGQYKGFSGSICYRDWSCGGGEIDPVAIVAELEAHGWKPCPTSWARYGRYRGALWPCAVADLSAEHSREDLNDCERVMPIALKSNYHTGASVELFMVSPDGGKWEIDIQDRRLPCRASARRVEFRGGWRFEYNTARLHAPYDIRINDELVGGRSARSGAALGAGTPPQSVDGWAYYEYQAHEPDDYPYSMAETLAALLEADASN
jgi:hypothetical protein